LAAPKAKTVVAVAAAVGTISNYGPNSHNGTQATGTANRAFDVTS
jgi:hypothetical protein